MTTYLGCRFIRVSLSLSPPLPEISEHILGWGFKKKPQNNLLLQLLTIIEFSANGNVFVGGGSGLDVDENTVSLKCNEAKGDRVRYVCA